MTPVLIRGHWRRLMLVATMLATIAPASGADASEASNPKKERERVRSEQAAVAGEVDALEATNEEVGRALEDLDANVADQQALLADARRAADQAAASLATAQQEEERARAEIVELESMVREIAIQEYMRPTTVDPMVVLSSETVADASRRSALLDIRTQRDADILDQLQAAREDVELRRQEAERAATRAEQQRGEVAGRVEQVEQARDQQAEFAASVEQRLDATLSEAAALADLDAELAGRIAAEEAQIAAALRARAASRPGPAPEAVGSRGGGSTGGTPSSGSPSSGSPSSGGSSSGRSSRAPASIVGSGSIVSVNGIRVSSQIADQLRALLDAAGADGHAFAGGGYRDPSSQVALRRSNCGSSDYAVYSMPASQCSPPTARPGASMHEQGLAVDFTYNGSLITSRSNPGFVWLAANASRFGFYNLPAEPWHWSVNGN
ncbi:MAG TPA: D-alanyl-D-alanine carboxypeptidase family protein [Acidimicrobiales bacterium]|nr:D-alanyl-D-alanine carboxypeptidase family protein [Acidimicrobiales bacterium]